MEHVRLTFLDKDFQNVYEISEGYTEFNYTASIGTDFSGTVALEITDDNKEFLSTVKENSHYVYVDDLDFSTHYLTVVDSAIRKDKILTLQLGGFNSWLSKIVAMGSNKANISGVNTITEDDYSFIKVFYADSGIELLWAVMHNLKDYLEAKNVNVPFKIDDLLNYSQDSGSTEWAKSYRINAADGETMDNVFSDIVDDCEHIISIDGTKTGWVISYLEPDLEFPEYILQYANYDVTEDTQQNRAESILIGSDLDGNDVIAVAEASSDAIFSNIKNDNKLGRSEAFQRLNDKAITDANNGTYNAKLDIFPGVGLNISLGNIYRYHTDLLSGQEFNGFLTQIDRDEKALTMTLSSFVDDSNISLKRPADDFRKLIFNPLDKALKTSRRADFKTSLSTGIRK